RWLGGARSPDGHQAPGGDSTPRSTQPPNPLTTQPPESERLAELRSRTPARILAGRAGASYRTSTHLQLRQDHAAARDAVEAEVDLTRDLGEELVRRFGLFEVRTQATGKGQFLMRPDLGRQLGDEARQTVTDRCPPSTDFQVVIGDGLSAAAVVAQV